MAYAARIEVISSGVSRARRLAASARKDGAGRCRRLTLDIGSKNGNLVRQGKVDCESDHAYSGRGRNAHDLLSRMNSNASFT
jgi:hypothetical protein